MVEWEPCQLRALDTGPAAPGQALGRRVSRDIPRRLTGDIPCALLGKWTHAEREVRVCFKKRGTFFLNSTERRHRRRQRRRKPQRENFTESLPLAHMPPFQRPHCLHRAGGDPRQSGGPGSQGPLCARSICRGGAAPPTQVTPARDASWKRKPRAWVQEPERGRQASLGPHAGQTRYVGYGRGGGWSKPTWPTAVWSSQAQPQLQGGEEQEGNKPISGRFFPWHAAEERTWEKSVEVF